MEKCSVSKATLGRLPCYLQHLREILKNSDEYVSATTIAKSLSLGEVQVRKDLNSVSGAGRPKIGYSVKDLIKHRKCFGLQQFGKSSYCRSRKARSGSAEF